MGPQLQVPWYWVKSHPSSRRVLWAAGLLRVRRASPSSVGQHGLAAVVYVDVQKVGVPVSAAEAAGMKMDPGILPPPAGAEDVVAAGGQRLGGLFRPGRRQGGKAGRRVGAEIPQGLFAQGTAGRSGQQRVGKEQRPRRQQVAGVDDVAVPLRQDGAVGRGPDGQRPAHGPGFFFQFRRDAPAVLPCQQQGVEGGVEHLTVIHGALLPLHPVRPDGMAEVFGQPRKGKVLPVGPAQPQPDQEQPVGLDGSPVAQPLEGAVGLFKISAVFGQTLLHPAAQLFRQGLPEEGGGPQPVFGAQAGFQRAPGAAFACGRARCCFRLRECGARG